MNRVYDFFLKKWYVPQSEKGNWLHVFSEEIQKNMLKIEKQALFESVLVAFLGQLFYFLPIYLMPNFFQSGTYDFFKDGKVLIPVFEIVWCVGLTVLEILILTLLHLKAVHRMAIETGYHTMLEEKSGFLSFVKDLGTEQRDKGITLMGLDPFQGISKTRLMLTNTLVKLKGVLANKFLRYLLQRFLGRYAVKFVLDLVGVPVYMIVNFLATKNVLNIAKTTIMGEHLIAVFMSKIPEKQISEKEKELLYDTLQLIAMRKRDFHKNHLILTKEIFSHFQIPVKEKHVFEEGYFDKMKEVSSDVQKICKDIVLLGFVLDGEVSYLEKKIIRRMIQEGFMTYTEKDVVLAAKAFMRGEGISLLGIS